MPGEELARQMRSLGQRITPQRRAVIDVVASARERMTPAEIYRRARRHHAGVGLATVYRTLELLSRLGLVERLHEPEGCQSYVADRAAGTHHHHVVCSQCGRVAEIPACDLGEHLRLVAEQTGFEIDAHWLELRGLCADCRAGRRESGVAGLAIQGIKPSLSR